MTATLDRPAALAFEVPAELLDAAPAEARGLARDEVRLLVASRADGELVDTAFSHLAEFLSPGDLVVVNTSATLPAAVPTAAGDLVVHLSTELPGGLWVVEVRRRCGEGSLACLDRTAGETLALPGGAAAQLLAPYPVGAEGPAGARLWVAALRLPEPVLAYLGGAGRPVRYGCADRAWPLSSYQTLFADEPGSAEMPSAGRAFTPAVLAALEARGVGVAPVVLHTGVSSLEAHEPPYPERYRVPAATAGRVNAARAGGSLVVAVGTTVTRALESAADEDGVVAPGSGWTDLVVTPERGVRAVDGLLTGWHEPEASHLMLLEAVAGRPLLERSYATALAARYRWHEFGDLHLVVPHLPGRR